MSGKGKFIVFEGGEGAGKTTQIKLLSKRMLEQNIPHIVTREPGATRLGQQLRKLLLDPETAINSRTEALLYAADRADHTDSIRDSLNNGVSVLCDRYIDSSVVYQGIGRGLGAAKIRELNEWATQNLTPDLVFILDVDPETGLSRATATEFDGKDRIEAEGLPFHLTVQTGFLTTASTNLDVYRVIAARQQKKRIAEQVWEAVAEKLDLKQS